MHQQGILKTDDLITRFFRLCTEMCVEISYRAQAEQQHNPAASAPIIRAKCYHNLDAFVRLIALLVKHSGEATNTVTKINLLNKVLLDIKKTKAKTDIFAAYSSCRTATKSPDVKLALFGKGFQVSQCERVTELCRMR